MLRRFRFVLDEEYLLRINIQDDQPTKRRIDWRVLNRRG